MKVAFVLGTSTGGTARHVRMIAAGCAARGVAVEVFGPAQTDRDFAFSGITGKPHPAAGEEAAAAPATTSPVPPATTSPAPRPALPATSPATPPGSATHASSVSFTPVEIAQRPRVLHDLRAIRRLRRLIGARPPDVVHAHGLRAGALAAIALAFVRPAAYAARPRLVVTVHNAPAAGGGAGAIYRVLELIVARAADSVLGVSPDLEERMRAAGARRVGRALVPAGSVPEGSVSAETRAEPVCADGTDPGRPVVLAVGRLAAQKGFGTLLEAATRWRDITPEPLLVIVGQGPLEAALRSQAARLRLDARFPGQRRDVPALLASAAVFVLPSVWEGQPLILQEALRAGVPIVATRAGGTPELTGEDAALLVPAGDPRRLADAVRAVLTEPALAVRLRRAAADRGRALPDEDDAVTAVLAEYDRVTRPRRYGKAGSHR